MGHALFTIGHSNRDLADFLAILREEEISAIADVRSRPASTRYPHFNAETLMEALRAEGMDYVFLGEELGARRSERECYVDGKARYDLIALCDSFRNGLDRIRRGAAQHRIALMCAEKDPLTCHRSILICRELRGELDIRHIIGRGQSETHEESEDRLLAHLKLPSRDLFRDREEILTEAYERQGDRIAYVESEADMTPTWTI